MRSDADAVPHGRPAPAPVVSSGAPIAVLAAIAAPSSAAVPVPPPDDRVACPGSVDELDLPADLDAADRRLHGDGVLVADKANRRLLLFRDGALDGCWRIGLGFAPAGHKSVEGDGRTPQGWYRTSDKPWSVFDDAIAIHYPNADDADAALRDRRIGRAQHRTIVEATRSRRVPPQQTALGGAILIHGGGSRSDWTLGCIALDDPDLQALRAALPRGMRTHLLVLP